MCKKETQFCLNGGPVSARAKKFQAIRFVWSLNP